MKYRRDSDGVYVCVCKHRQIVHSGVGHYEGKGPCNFDSRFGGTSQGDGDCPCPKFRKAVNK
jgi:hypothetical protein